MIKYKNFSGKSNVESYEIGEDYIKVKFNQTAKIYTYSHVKAGIKHVEELKRLANLGQGLNSYIMKNVREKYD